MAGLSAAWRLSKLGFRVTIFEKGLKPGLAAHSVNVAELISGVGTDLPGDVPSRMFNDSLWPSVCELYGEAGVEVEPVDHEQTFHRNDEVLLKVGLPYRMLPMLKNIIDRRSRDLLQSVQRFREAGLAALDSHEFPNATFGDFIKTVSQGDYSPDFFEGFLFPSLTSTVFTCPKAELNRFPCELVLQALARITDQQKPLMRTVHGSSDAAERLLTSVDTIKFDAMVDSVSESNHSANVVVNGESHSFDHVIVATQANHASRLVADSLPEESKLLQGFKYVDVPVVLHTDENVLPSKKSDWSTFNFDSHMETSTCTVWMNRFHQQWPEIDNVFHSIFPSAKIDPSKTLSSVVMQRPVVDFQTADLHKTLDRLHSRERRIWFAGSYAAPGVPLLESAAASSNAVVSKLCAQVSNTVAS